VLELPKCVTEGKTSQEALKNAQEAVVEMLSHSEVVPIQIEPRSDIKTGNPWIDNFGCFQNDPTFDDFLAEMEAYRRELDQEEGRQA